MKMLSIEVNNNVNTSLKYCNKLSCRKLSNRGQKACIGVSFDSKILKAK